MNSYVINQTSLKQFLLMPDGKNLLGIVRKLVILSYRMYDLSFIQSCKIHFLTTLQITARVWVCFPTGPFPLFNES